MLGLQSSSRGILALSICVTALGGCAHSQGTSGESAQSPAPSPSETAAPLPGEPPAPTGVETKEVTYASGPTQLKGFIAYPARTDKRPGVLVVHEWWGHNEHARRSATRLAEMGYVALAVDMYGDGKLAGHPDDAKKFMMEVMGNAQEGAKRFEAARALLAADPRTDADKIAAIGYCMGGAIVLNMARTGSDLDAVASFHGNLAAQQPMKPNAFAGKILVAHGGADPFVPPEQVEAFKKEMDAASAKYDLVVYPGAKHGFTNPEATENGKKFSIPIEYNAQADAESWQKLQQLLAEVWPAT